MNEHSSVKSKPIKKKLKRRNKGCVIRKSVKGLPSIRKFVQMSSSLNMPKKTIESCSNDYTSDNEADTTIKEVATTPISSKDTGYRLRNLSYQQGMLASTPISGTDNAIKAQKRGGNASVTTVVREEELEQDEMGSIEDLLPPKFLLRKEEFEKKNNTNKIDVIFDSVNKLYNMHAQVTARTKSLEFAVFDEEDGILPQLQGLASHAKDSGDKQSTMTKELIELREELDIAKGLIQKQSKQIKELKAKQVDIITRSMAGNLTISGLKGDNNKADTKALIYNFLEEHLEVEPEEDEEIPVAHRLGPPVKGIHRPVVFRCPPTLRKKIFDNVTKLAGKSFSINQQYPDAITEQRREIRQAMKDVKKAEENKDEQDKSTFLIRNGRLYINGQLQRKKLIPPTPEELFVCDSERKKMDSIKMVSSQRKSAKECVFQAFACSVTSMNDVHLAYKRLFREYPGADHIAAAFNVEREDGFQDDSEFGSGFRLLRVITDARLLNTAVFVVRYYGGENLGAQRFVVMKELAEEAIYKLG